MKKSKFLFAVLAVALVIAALPMAAFAASTDECIGYKNATLSLSTPWIGKDTATATITSCECDETNNYLMAGVQIQYLVGDYKYWSPQEGYYWYNSGTDTARQSCSASEYDVTFARAWFQAECYTSGAKDNSIYRTATP